MIDAERISFSNSRGDTLVGMLHHPAKSNSAGAAILCHGMEPDKNSEKLIFLGQQLALRGILTLRFDFSYVGESSGKFEDITYSGEVEDLQAAYELMRKRDDGKIAIFSSSMSGTLLILHGDADEVVPVAEANELHGCLKNSKRLSILKDADHRLADSAIMQQAMHEALDWLTEHVR